MRDVIIDLEMNAISEDYSEKREIWRMEIMEIGAIMLDDDNKEIDRYMAYVKPQYNEEISPRYTKLTGITTEMVQDAPHFAEAFRNFSDWCKASGHDVKIHAWSPSDYLQVVGEMKLKGYEMNEYETRMMEPWSDFQQVYMKKLGLERAISLKNALMYAGLDFEGRAHDALFDAKNTAELYALVHDEKKFKVYLKTVLEALSHKPETNTLGELFDFTDFN